MVRFPDYQVCDTAVTIGGGRNPKPSASVAWSMASF